MSKRLYSICIVTILCIAGSIIGNNTIYAAENPNIVEVYVEDDDLVLYVREISSEIEKVDGYIASEYVEDIKYSKLSQATIPIKTLILIDTSLSVKEAEQEHFINLLIDLIDEKSDNESFAIASYGEEIEYLCDYNNDRWELIKTLDQLEYKKQKTYLIEILYNLINEFDNSEEECFYRIIVFTDGADSNTEGVTMTELFNLLKASPYPIYTIGSEYNSNADKLKELFSISRITNTNYTTFTSDSDLEKVKEIIDKIEDYTRIVLKVPKTLQDGSIKNIRLEIKDSNNTYILSHDVRMNMYTNKSDKEDVDSKETVETVNPINNMPEAVENNEPMFGKSEVVKDKITIKNIRIPEIIYIFLVLAGILIVIIVIVLISLSKKNKRINNNANSPSYNTEEEKGTEMIANINPEKEERTGTQYLFTPKKKIRIKLKDLASHQIYEKEINGIVTIGRLVEKNDIAISKEPSVSGQHCMIYLKDSDVYIEDKNSSNHTFVNDHKIENATIINTGDIITLGRIKLEVIINRE